MFYELDNVLINSINIRNNKEINIPIFKSLVINKNIINTSNGVKNILNNIPELKFINKLDWSRLILAGGAICNLILNGAIEYKFSDNKTSGSDLDFFFYDTDISFIKKTMLIVERSLTNEDVVYAMSNNCISVVLKNYKIQFIFDVYSSIIEIMNSFDLGSSQVFYNGDKVYLTEDGKFSYECMTNLCLLDKKSKTCLSRLMKYNKRGFSILCLIKSGNELKYIDLKSIILEYIDETIYYSSDSVNNNQQENYDYIDSTLKYYKKSTLRQNNILLKVSSNYYNLMYDNEYKLDQYLLNNRYKTIDELKDILLNSKIVPVKNDNEKLSEFTMDIYKKIENILDIYLKEHNAINVDEIFNIYVKGIQDKNILLKNDILSGTKFRKIYTFNILVFLCILRTNKYNIYPFKNNIKKRSKVDDIVQKRVNVNYDLFNFPKYTNYLFDKLNKELKYVDIYIDSIPLKAYYDIIHDDVNDISIIKSFSTMSLGMTNNNNLKYIFNKYNRFIDDYNVLFNIYLNLGYTKYTLDLLEKNAFVKELFFKINYEENTGSKSAFITIILKGYNDLLEYYFNNTTNTSLDLKNELSRSNMNDIIEKYVYFKNKSNYINCFKLLVENNVIDYNMSIKTGLTLLNYLIVTKSYSYKCILSYNNKISDFDSELTCLICLDSDINSLLKCCNSFYHVECISTLSRGIPVIDIKKLHRCPNCRAPLTNDLIQYPLN